MRLIDLLIKFKKWYLVYRTIQSYHSIFHKPKYKRKQKKKDAELQNIIAEQKLRTQRILGELISNEQNKVLMKTQATAKSSTAKDLMVLVE